MSEHPIVACYRGLDSPDAVRFGALVARALDEPFMLVGAYVSEPVGFSASMAPMSASSPRAGLAQATLRRAHAYAGNQIEVREQTVPSVGVAEALIQLARDIDACVLVLGRDTQSYVTRWLLPRAPCAVAVAPLSVPLPQAGPFERIGVAYDGSPTAQCALVAATHLAQATGARLVLLAAAPTTEHATTWLDVARLSVGGKAKSLETRALLGYPPATLARASEELDLLVCGSRGRGRPFATILGSVSAYLVDHARCPVLVVPPVVRKSDSGPLGITSAAVNV